MFALIYPGESKSARWFMIDTDRRYLQADQRKFRHLDVYHVVMILIRRQDLGSPFLFDRRIYETMEKYIVSDDRKFIYFVVQKVACSSVKTALLPLFDVRTDGYETIRDDGTAGLKIHKVFDGSKYQIRKRRLLERLDGQYEDYFKFAFVRNPWDRLVSCYCNKLSKYGRGLKLPVDKDIELYPGMPFADFVEAVHTIPDSEANIHFQSQYKVICGSGGDRPILADFVGRYENLQADFDFVAKRIGGNQDLQLPHILRSRSRKNRPYTDFYDQRLRDLVYERFQEDVELFGYSY